MITVPATWEVAGTIAAGPLQLVAQIAGILLVDATWIAFWVSLDAKVNEPLANKVLDVVGTLLMYALVLLVGAVHGEGIAGWLFRGTIGLAIARSVVPALAHVMQENASRMLAETGATGREARKQRRILRKAFKPEVAQGLKVYLADVRTRGELQLERAVQQQAAGLAAIEALAGGRQQQAMQLEHIEMFGVASKGHEVVSFEDGYAVTCNNSASGFAHHRTTGEMLVYDNELSARMGMAAHVKGCKTNGARILAGG
jgi:hypothetical protein